jgi:hypothetical protein
MTPAMPDAGGHDTPWDDLLSALRREVAMTVEDNIGFAKLPAPRRPAPEAFLRMERGRSGRRRSRRDDGCPARRTLLNDPSLAKAGDLRFSAPGPERRKAPVSRAFQDGRGRFRTCDLSRVKRAFSPNSDRTGGRGGWLSGAA